MAFKWTDPSGGSGGGGGLDIPTADARYVNETGDTMTGALRLDTTGANPTPDAATRGSLWFDQGADAGTVGAPATGLIQSNGPASSIPEGSTFTLNDGVNPAVVFEFDSDASVVETPTLRRVDITGATSADLVQDAIESAINGAPTLAIAATENVGDTSWTDLVNDANGTLGNNAILFDVPDLLGSGLVFAGMEGGVDGIPDALRVVIKTASDGYVLGKSAFELTPFVLVENGPYESLRDVLAAAGAAASPSEPKLVLIGPGHWREDDPVTLPPNLVIMSSHGRIDDQSLWAESPYGHIDTALQVSFQTRWEADPSSSALIGLYIVPCVTVGGQTKAPAIRHYSDNYDSLYIIGCHISVAAPPAGSAITSATDVVHSLIDIYSGECDIIDTTVFFDNAGALDVHAVVTRDYANVHNSNLWGQTLSSESALALYVREGGYADVVSATIRGNLKVGGNSGLTLRNVVATSDVLTRIFTSDDVIIRGACSFGSLRITDNENTVSGQSYVQFGPLCEDRNGGGFVRAIQNGALGAVPEVRRQGLTIDNDLLTERIVNSVAINYEVSRLLAGYTVVRSYTGANSTTTLRSEIIDDSWVRIVNGSVYPNTISPESGTIEGLSSIVLRPFSSVVLHKANSATWKVLEWSTYPTGNPGGPSNPNPFSSVPRISQQALSAFPSLDEGEGFAPGDRVINAGLGLDYDHELVFTGDTSGLFKWRHTHVVQAGAPGNYLGNAPRGTLLSTNPNNPFGLFVSTQDAVAADRWREIGLVVSDPSDPTATDDVSLHFPVGTVWVNTTTNAGFILVDNAENAAVWSSLEAAQPTPYIVGPASTGAPYETLTDLFAATTPPSGSLILLYPGDYTDNVTFPGNAYHIKGTDSVSATRNLQGIDTARFGNVSVSGNWTVTGTATIEGIQFSKTSDSNARIRCSLNSNVSIVRCLIQTFGGAGRNLQIESNAKVTLSQCYIDHNASGGECVYMDASTANIYFEAVGCVFDCPNGTGIRGVSVLGTNNVYALFRECVLVSFSIIQGNGGTGSLWRIVDSEWMPQAAIGGGFGNLASGSMEVLNSSLRYLGGTPDPARFVIGGDAVGGTLLERGNYYQLPLVITPTGSLIRDLEARTVVDTAEPQLSDDTDRGYGIGSVWVAKPGTPSVRAGRYHLATDTQGGGNSAQWNRTPRPVLTAAAPGQFNDKGNGTAYGDIWINSSDRNAYVCVRDDDNNALWQLIPKHFTDATTDPIPADDGPAGYPTGTVWINTVSNAIFISVDDTDNAAIWLRQVNHYQTTTDPTANDDASSGYPIGSVWVNTTTDAVFISVDGTTAAAAWRRIPRHVSSASVPVATDDGPAGYPVGTLWVNTTTDLVYVSVDDTDDAAVWIVIKKHTSQTVDPAATDDGPAGYPVGSIWINTTDDSGWLSVDDTDDAAIWIKITTGSQEKSVFFATRNASSQIGNHPVQSITTASSGFFGIRIPDDFASLNSAVILLIVSSTVAAQGPGRDIDILVDAGGNGEAYNTHTASDTTTTYDFTGQTDQIVELPITTLLSFAAAGDQVGIQVDHNGIGGTLYYLGVEINYNPA